MLSAFRDYGYGLAVVFGNHAEQDRMSIRLERDFSPRLNASMEACAHIC